MYQAVKLRTCVNILTVSLSLLLLSLLCAVFWKCMAFNKSINVSIYCILCRLPITNYPYRCYIDTLVTLILHSIL